MNVRELTHIVLKDTKYCLGRFTHIYRLDIAKVLIDVFQK
jgi:hypothetical protein